MGVVFAVVPVRMHVGAFPLMHLKNVLNSHLNESASSSLTRAKPNNVVCKWLLVPTNTPSGIWYLLVLYVVSNVTQSPKS